MRGLGHTMHHVEISPAYLLFPANHRPQLIQDALSPATAADAGSCDRPLLPRATFLSFTSYTLVFLQGVMSIRMSQSLKMYFYCDVTGLSRVSIGFPRLTKHHV